MKHQLLGLADRLAQIKVVLCDLDHTLLNAERQVPPDTDGLLDRWLSAGYGFVIATGREPRRARNLSPVLDQCPLICYNGTWIEHLGDVKYTRPMSRDLTKSAIECLRRTNPNAWIGLEIDDRLYAPEPLGRWGDAIAADPNAIHAEAFKVFCPKSHLSPNEADRIRTSVPPGTCLWISDDYDVVQFEDAVWADKSVGAAWLLDQWNLDLARCMALGDETNDLTMVSRSGIGIAMSNSNPELLAAADLCAPNHDAQGVKRVLSAVLELQPQAPV